LGEASGSLSAAQAVLAHPTTAAISATLNLFMTTSQNPRAEG
jgi:hypothetical protein